MISNKDRYHIDFTRKIKARKIPLYFDFMRDDILHENIILCQKINFFSLKINKRSLKL